jgi:uncharacterized membrane protein
MNWAKFKKVLGRGIALAIPTAIVLYVFGRIVGVFSKMIAPEAQRIGVEHIWGKLTLSIFAVILIIVIILLLGLLMQVRLVSKIKAQVEEVILQFIPSLNQLKLMAADTLDLDDSESSTWRPVLVYYKEWGHYSSAFVVEEDDELVTLFVTLEHAIKQGEIRVYHKEKIELIPIGFTDLHKGNRAAGKGFLKLIQDHRSAIKKKK